MSQNENITPVATCDPVLRWPRLPSGQDAQVLVLGSQLEQSQWFDAERLEKLQLHQLHSLLLHAHDHVEWYAKSLGNLALDRGVPLDPETWQTIPVLLRSHVQDADNRLHAGRVPLPYKHSGESISSGSTGQPVKTIKSAVDQVFFLANNLRFFKWANWNFSKTVANITPSNAKTKELAKSGQPTAWAPGHVSGPMYYFPVSKTTVEKIEWLERIKPTYLIIFPSALDDIVRVLDEEGKTLPTLRGIMSQSEMLDDRIRQSCEDKFGVRFFEIYSTQEIGVIAVQCPEHAHYHVMSESVMVEILDEDDQPCETGKMGRVVVTSLHNFNMPLIRYDTGDYAIKGDPCDCGRGLPVISQICGRFRNLFVNPQGQRFWPTIGGTGNLFSLGKFRRMQFIQHAINELEVKLVADHELDGDQEISIKQQLINHFWPEMIVTITYVDDLPRSPSGKFEDFMCLVAD